MHKNRGSTNKSCLATTVLLITWENNIQTENRKKRKMLKKKEEIQKIKRKIEAKRVNNLEGYKKVIRVQK